MDTDAYDRAKRAFDAAKTDLHRVMDRGSAILGALEANAASFIFSQGAPAQSAPMGLGLKSAPCSYWPTAEEITFSLDQYQAAIKRLNDELSKVPEPLRGALRREVD